jgi:L-threonylcarbamoyladenylate synthase
LRPTIKSTQIITVLDESGLEEGIQKGKDTILSGGLVAFPTESFYGLAVNSLDEKAIKRLFQAKKRKSDQPILLLIPSIESLDQYVRNIPEVAHKLIERYWPGGLTLIFKAAPNVSPLLTAGTGKIGVRLSSHPVAAALVRSVGIPVTGTSANISGQPPCSMSNQVLESLGQSVDLILDGGSTEGKAGSTLLDVTVDPPLILRQGMIEISERLD